MSINAGDHALIVGQTGSGKSVLLQRLIQESEIAPVFILDSKGDDGFLNLNQPGETSEIFDGGIFEFKKFIMQPVRRLPTYIIIRPPLEEIMNHLILDDYLVEIYTKFKGQCLMIVDELYMIHKSGRCGNGLTAFLTRGRSQGKSLLGATQRPSWISGFCLSECTHYYVFRLIDINDRKRLTHIGYEKDKMLDRFHFYEYNAKDGRGILKPPLPIAPNTLQKNSQDLNDNWI